MGTVDVLRAIDELHTSGDYSDGTVICGDRTWKVHKAILAKRSEYFARAFYGEFKEAKAAKVEFQEDAPNTIEAMLEYLYTLAYNVTEAAAAIQHARLYVAGDKYQLPNLKAYALDQYVTTLTCNVSVHDLVDEVYVKMDVHPELRKPLIQYIVSILNALLEDQHFVLLLEELDDLSLDVIKALAPAPGTAEMKASTLLKPRHCASRKCVGIKTVRTEVVCNHCNVHFNLAAPT